ncbi:MAG TPA: hypothetical protein VN922_12205 [Bacteroidia bacterium]|nr:hypothetical protein [Bacteroidia bacterium]
MKTLIFSSQVQRVLIYLLFAFTLVPSITKAQEMTNTCPSCYALDHLPTSFQFIKDSAKSIFRKEDYCKKECLLALIDTLENMFIKTSKLEYLIPLDSLACYSDGYISESLANSRMFYKNFKPYIDYLYHNKDTNNCLVFYLESAEDMSEKEGEEFIAKEEIKYNLPLGEKLFLKAILMKVDYYNKQN